MSHFVTIWHNLNNAFFLTPIMGLTYDLKYLLSSITLLHHLAHSSWSNQLIFAKHIHLHQYFTDSETLKVRFRRRKKTRISYQETFPQERVSLF